MSTSAGEEDASLDAGDQGADAAQISQRGEVPVWPGADEEVSLAYGAKETSLPLEVAAQVAQLDVHVNVDTTASISEEIDALQRSLRNDVISAIAARVPDASFGVSRFADFPRTPFGTSSDHAYVLLTPITSDLDVVDFALALLDNPLDDGFDPFEAGGESLYQVATGEGYVDGSTTFIKPWDHVAAVGGGTLGGVGFRPLAYKVVMHVTDIISHTPADYAAEGLQGTHGLDDASKQLQKLGAHLIGIMSTRCAMESCRSDERYFQLRDELSKLALATGTSVRPSEGKCPMGIDGAPLDPYEKKCPLVFDVRDDGTGLTDTVKDAILRLLDGLLFGEVHAEASTDPLGFVRAIEVSPLKQSAGIAAPETADRLPLDAHDGITDSYLSVGKRVKLGFRVKLRNDRLAPSDVPQRFRITVRVLGDGAALEERTLRIVVPAGKLMPHVFDAGSDASMDLEDAGNP